MLPSYYESLSISPSALRQRIVTNHALMGYGAKRETALYWKASAGKENVHVIYGD
jgi:hypothetical protein